MSGEAALREALDRSLAGSVWREHAATLAATLSATGHDLTSLEASVGSDARPGRLMVEGTAPETLRSLLALLGVPRHPLAEALLAFAEMHALPTIAGWDVREGTTAKLYVNASDAAGDIRRSLAECVRRARPTPLPVDAPHVVGLNLAEVVTLKVYAQQMEPPPMPEPLRSWAASASVAGWVRSWTLGETAAIRAVFAALAPSSGAPELSALPGWGEAHARALPFGVGFAKSVGFDPSGANWVAYVKPPEAEPAGHDLEPALVLRAGDVEIGVHVEPRTARAYVHTRDKAISYRVRQGSPSRAAIAAAMAWAAERVHVQESGGSLEWTDPPEPWSVHDD